MPTNPSGDPPNSKGTKSDPRSPFGGTSAGPRGTVAVPSVWKSRDEVRAENGETITLTRDDLHAAVWSSPVRDVAKRYRISDVAFAKICKTLKVPLPGRGYWAKVAAGQTVEQVPLPDATTGTPATHSFFIPHAQTAPKVPKPAPEPEIANPPPPSNRIEVAAALRAPHPLVKDAQRVIGDHCKGTPEVVWMARVEVLDIRVSRTSLQRALRIMDALLRALEERGYRVRIRPLTEHRAEFQRGSARETTATVVRIGTDEVEFGINELERVKGRERPPPTNRSSLIPLVYPHGYWKIRVPTGELALRVRSGDERSARSFTDTSKRRVEDLLDGFLAELIRVAEELRERRVSFEKAQRERAEEARREQDAQNKRRVEAMWFKELEGRATDWERARRIGTFLDELVAGRLNGPDPEFDRWLAWARQRVEGLARSAVEDVVNSRQV